MAVARGVAAWGRRALAASVIVGGVIMNPFHPEKRAVQTGSTADALPVLADEGPLPDFGGAPSARQMRPSTGKERFMPENIVWLNSAPLSREALRGKVVLVNFWTYSCINSLRELPYIESWAKKYKDAGLVVLGIHTPEFSFEKERPNVERAVREYKVAYPVAIDSNYQIWQAFNNEYWPANYVVDGKGRIRYHYFGEGEYAESERVIQELLKENGAMGVPDSIVSVSAAGVEAPPGDVQQSPETYVGYRRSERFASPEGVAHDTRSIYTAPARPGLNQWGLSGAWNVGPESGVLEVAPGKIVYRFHSRDLHVVFGPAKNGKPVRFQVKLDGRAPADDHGADTAPNGAGEIREPRLYQLIRQKGQGQDRTFEIEFLDPGVHAYVFTFG